MGSKFDANKYRNEYSRGRYDRIQIILPVAENEEESYKRYMENRAKELGFINKTGKGNKSEYVRYLIDKDKNDHVTK